MKTIATVFMALAITSSSFANEMDAQELYAQLDASLDLTNELGSRCKKELFEYSKAKNECYLFGRILIIYLPNLEAWVNLSDAQKQRVYAENSISSDDLGRKINKTAKYIKWIRLHSKNSP